MEASAIASWILNGLLALVMMFMKSSADRVKEDIKHLQERQTRFQEEYLKKDDFREFKQELWDRLDRFENSVKVHLNRV